jgi:hypothetical protein
VFALCSTLAPARAQTADGSATPEVFRRYAGRVIKIHVVETSSAAKAELGSGFFISSDGEVVTNYHVVAEVVHQPTRYRAEWIDASAKAHPLHLLAVDVVHDLAILRADDRPAAHFTLAPVHVAQGTRLYALGHPNDLGLSIVEGTFNGLLRYTLYPKIHFTGAINPGMSGGPAITEDGRVVGVNVATEGDGIGFLVPIDRAVALAARVHAPGFRPPTSFLAAIGDQLHAYQDVYLASLFADSTPTVTLGHYRLPTRPAPFFRCWADATRHDKDQPYDVITHQCSTDDYVYVNAQQSTGILSLTHRMYTSAVLDRIRFFSLYQTRFQNSIGGMGGDERDITRFSCQTRNVRHDATRMRAVLCLRRYRKFTGLYDAVLTAAILGGTHSGLITTLTLSGVSFENAMRVTTRYLERIDAGAPAATGDATDDATVAGDAP